MTPLAHPGEVMSGQERHTDMMWNWAKARDEPRSKKKTFFRQNIKKQRRASGVMLKSVTDVTLRKQKTTTEERMINETQVQACFKPGAVNTTARNIAPPSEPLPWVWTQSASFHESALWKIILIPLHSYKFLFHKGSVLTASLVLHHRETVCGEEKLNDLILPGGFEIQWL